MKCLLQVLIVAFWPVPLIEAQNVLLNLPSTQTITRPSGSYLNANKLNIAGQDTYAAIPDALTSSSTTGSALIPPGYAGIDVFTHGAPRRNIRMQDRRTFNAVTPNGRPETSLKAAAYGARCDGSADDTASIQSALNAAVAIAGGDAIPNPPIVPVTVELPQGYCKITAPLTVTGYGSIRGSANGTWLVAFVTSWPAGRGMVEFVAPYNQTAGANGPTMDRYVKDIAFRFTGNCCQVTGVKVYNQTGNSPIMFYPAGADPALYQIPGVRVEGNTFETMDTGVELDDCAECIVFENQFNFVKYGVFDKGNNYALVVDDNWIQNGSSTYTNRKGPAYGIYSQAAERWQCVGGTGSSCNGGRVQETKTVSPQGLNVTNTDIESFDSDVYLVNINGAVLDHNGFDNGGASAQSSTPYPTVYISQPNNWVYLVNNYIATTQKGASPVAIGAPPDPPADGVLSDGLWIQNNTLYNYNSSGATAAGIVFLSGSNAQRKVWVKDNICGYTYSCIDVQHPLWFSTITGNYGFALPSGTLIYLEASGSGSSYPGAYQGTTISDNTTSNSENIAVYRLHSGSSYGLTIGSNYAPGTGSTPVQATGYYNATGNGCSISGGAVGGICTATISLPTTFPDTNYRVLSCQVVGASSYATVSTVGSEAPNQFTLAEVSLTTGAVSGGNINCLVYHQ